MRRIALLIFVLILFTIIVNAQTNIPKQKPNSNTIPKTTSVNNNTTQHKPTANDSVSLHRDSLSKIKAILVVGGPVEESQQEYINEMKSVALYLKSIGVQVKEFYNPNAKWNDIVHASVGSNIFLYAGHGTDLGGEGKAGGLCLSDGDISSDTILKRLKLHKNALILFHGVCNSAGSSAADKADIGVHEAIQRISDYAHPFILLGAEGYYANNYSGSLKLFLKDFFNKKSIKQIYKKATSLEVKIDTIQKYMYNPIFEISVAGSTPPGSFTRITSTNGKKKVEKNLKHFKEYDIAFVGIPNFSVLDFFK